MKKYPKIFLSFAFLSFLIIFSCVYIPTVTAQVEVNSEVNLVNPIGGKILKDKDPAKVKSAAQGISGPGKNTWALLIGGIIKRGMGLIGSITMMTFVYGGFLWVTSGGKSDRIEQGKKIMLWATIGVFIIFSAYAILSVIIKGLGVVGTV